MPSYVQFQTLSQVILSYVLAWNHERNQYCLSQVSYQKLDGNFGCQDPDAKILDILISFNTHLPKSSLFSFKMKGFPRREVFWSTKSFHKWMFSLVTFLKTKGPEKARNYTFLIKKILKQKLLKFKMNALSFNIENYFKTTINISFFFFRRRPERPPDPRLGERLRDRDRHAWPPHRHTRDGQDQP